MRAGNEAILKGVFKDLQGNEPLTILLPEGVLGHYCVIFTTKPLPPDAVLKDRMQKEKLLMLLPDTTTAAWVRVTDCCVNRKRRRVQITKYEK